MCVGISRWWIMEDEGILDVWTKRYVWLEQQQMCGLWALQVAKGQIKTSHHLQCEKGP